MAQHTAEYVPTQEDWQDYESFADAQDRDYDRASDAAYSQWVDDFEHRGTLPRLADMIDVLEEVA